MLDPEGFVVGIILQDDHAHVMMGFPDEDGDMLQLDVGCPVYARVLAAALLKAAGMVEEMNDLIEGHAPEEVAKVVYQYQARASASMN